MVAEECVWLNVSGTMPPIHVLTLKHQLSAAAGRFLSNNVSFSLCGAHAQTCQGKYQMLAQSLQAV